MAQAGGDFLDGLVDVSGKTPALSAYAFIRVASPDVTLTGYFVGIHGEQEGGIVSYTISNSVVTLTSLYNTANTVTTGTPLPANYYGFVGSLSGAVYESRSALPDGTVNTAPAAGCNKLGAQSQYVALGRVPLVDIERAGGGTTGSDAANGVTPTAQKPVIAATYSDSIDVSYGTAINHRSKNAAGLFKAFDVSNVNAALRWFQIHNTGTALAGSEVPIESFPIPAGSASQPGNKTLGYDFFGPNGIYCSTGITWAMSTTQGTYTAATAADHNVIVHYN
jgi:hypothetical protein